MKRRQFSQAALASLTLSAATVSAQTAPYQEGIEYVSLDKRVPTEAGKGKIEVLEFFWYSCPHCNAFEPRFASWVKALPKDVEVKRVPVRFRDDFEPQQRAIRCIKQARGNDCCCCCRCCRRSTLQPFPHRSCFSTR
jgi:thiol:disulfide interchange protein DsbA